MIINHNLPAMNASRQYKTNAKSTKKSSEKLSTGYRINRASDDAAGLAISEKMRAQIRGLNQASDNIQDGISYVQTAEGALNEVSDMLNRMTELAVQAANDTNTDDDREAIDLEIQELKEAIQSIFTDTKYNDMQIWGEDNSTPTPIGTQKVKAVATKNVSQSFRISETNKWAVAKTAYTIKADENGYWVTWTGWNGKTYETTKTSWEDSGLSIDDSGKVTSDGSLNIKVNSTTLDTVTHKELEGIALSFGFSVERDATIADIVASINESDVETSNSASCYMTIKRDTSVVTNGLSISGSSSMTYAAFLYSDRTFGTNDSEHIEAKSYTASTGSDIYKSSFTMGYADSSSTQDAQDNAAQSNWTVNAEATSSSITANTYDGMQNIENHYWWYQSTYTSGGYTYHRYYGSGGSLSKDGITKGSLDEIQRSDDVANQYNLQNVAYTRLFFSMSTDDTGYLALNDTAYNPSNVGSYTLTISGVRASTTDDDVKNLMDSIQAIDIYSSGYGSGYISTYALSSAVGGKIKQIDQTVYDYDIQLHVQCGSDAGDYIIIEYTALTLDKIGIKNANTLTQSDASEAIEAINNAREVVSGQRALFGSYQNRLEHARSVDDITAENTQSAESTLRDLDMAEGMVEHSKNNILLQVAQAMIAQANQSPDSVINLLQ